MSWLMVITMAATLLGPAQVPGGFADLQTAHIEAHVPSAENFAAFMERDLRSFLDDRAGERLEFEMLRDAPTQSGAAYPKFYVWVRTGPADGWSISGAVRLAAIDRQRFEVTDFISREDILSGAADLASVFPSALVGPIRNRASLGD